jgi:hypothetical protein
MVSKTLGREDGTGWWKFHRMLRPQKHPQHPHLPPQMLYASELEALRELVDTVKDEVAQLRRQLQFQAETYERQSEANQRQLEAKDKQIEQLHIFIHYRSQKVSTIYGAICQA